MAKVGRPALVIDKEAMYKLLEIGFSANQVAKIIGASESTVRHLDDERFSEAIKTAKKNLAREREEKARKLGLID